MQLATLPRHALAVPGQTRCVNLAQRTSHTGGAACAQVIMVTTDSRAIGWDAILTLAGKSFRQWHRIVHDAWRQVNQVS